MERARNVEQCDGYGTHKVIHLDNRDYKSLYLIALLYVHANT